MADDPSKNPLATPYVNTISVAEEVPIPGDENLEWHLRSLARWNAMAMVIRANRLEKGIGGHISTYASAATLYEVGFNHFFRGHQKGVDKDLLYIQGHASPGIYARAFLEGRISQQHLENFRRELKEGGGLSSYPHPWLMPDFWEFPTVSMGIGPIMAIYQARFMRYLENRGLREPSTAKVWAFLGDGETDEPEALGAISLAGREKLNNLIFVVNCNLQRLDGPVRGNGKIIQELEGLFRGAGWNVIKVIWGSDWDKLLEKDTDGLLVKRMTEIVDGQYQKYTVSSGDYIRKHFFGADPKLLEMVSHLSDAEIRNLRRGGHDPKKVYNAYKRAVEEPTRPTLILAKTIKGYGLGESGEGKNITHQQKKLNEDELREFRSRFGVPIADEDVFKAPFYRPDEAGPEIQYMKSRREALGGPLPKRIVDYPAMPVPDQTLFDEFYQGTGEREVSTTMAFVRILTKLLQDKEIGKWIVPIIPDEARTFGMESLFRPYGIYSSIGQLYEPADAETILYYREAKDGQLLEEGITEAGSISSFVAAGTAYANFGVPTIPFFIYYSMFGLQRVGDFVWAAADSRTKGFLVGATAGRTTLAGEGLQHQDGQSHVLALPVPNLRCYDPAFAYELAVIIRDGMDRMYNKREDIFYYLTVGNENYPMAAMPEGVEEGILKGLYPFKRSAKKKSKSRAHLVGSAAIFPIVLKAAQVLEEDYGVATHVWSATSYKELYRDALDAERWNLLHPGEKPRVPYVTECFAKDEGVVVAVSDYIKSLPGMLSKWIGQPHWVLGTDGFGRSEGRESLRDFFEVDHRYIILATLTLLHQEGKVAVSVLKKAIKDLEIDPEKINPLIS